ncbi:MAG TPA: flagellar hook-basal body protein, partial [Candidatus Sulfotelmatobacter sp.]|nr:flagellar hook-basal body protein [Candidatus Sulfotelmatobacter sp.]
MARTLLPSRCMNVSLYQAAAAMNAHSRWQEAIAENLASSSVPGARKREVSFSTVEAGLAPGAAGLPQNHYLMPGSTTAINFRQGTLRPTNLPTDLAIEGPGFLEVQLPNGTRAYTRDGELQLSAQGQLVTKQGYPVLGDGGPLQLDSNNPAPISVSPTGEVSQGGEVKGRIRLAEFDQPGLLKAINDGYFLADNPNLQAGAARASQLRQGFLEGSNTSPTTEMASLITAMRMFEANQRVLQSQDE